MAELESACCSSEVQVSCCEPQEKAACCDGGPGCGCAEGAHDVPADAGALRERVRERYAAAAVGSAPAQSGAVSLADQSGAIVFGASLYGEEGAGVVEDALGASLGC